MHLKEAETPVSDRALAVVVDGQGDIWFKVALEDYFVSPAACNHPTDLGEIEDMYGIAYRFYEGDEMTIIL